MKKKQMLFIGLLFVSITVTFAENKDVVKAPAYVEFSHSLGFQVGEISGSGLSYQTWISKDLALMSSFGAFYQPIGQDSNFLYYDEILNYSLGEELQYRVYGADYEDWFSAQLYTFLGLNHSGDISSVVDVPSYSTGEGEDKEYVAATYKPGPYSPHFTFGAGIGIELIAFRHISMPIEIGYALTWSPLEETLAEQFAVDLKPQFGFRYRY